MGSAYCPVELDPNFADDLSYAGTIDEKIYQRQLMKGQIADMMEGQGGAKGKKAGAGSRFSAEELKELFKLRLDTASDTHDLLCKGSAAAGAYTASLHVCQVLGVLDQNISKFCSPFSTLDENGNRNMH